jgi:lipid-binding SYLF domain-containing protein
MYMTIKLSRRAFTMVTLGSAVIALQGCTTTTPESSSASGSAPQPNEAKRREIQAEVNSAITRLYQEAPQSREMVQRAQGVLVFPSVFKAGFVVGGEYGEGALMVGGRPAGYYSATAGSFGLQAGAQTKSVYILFMTPEALAQFRSSSGWQVGADASVAMINTGAAGSVSSDTARQPVVGYVLTGGGLMVDASLSGTKITRLDV